MARPRVEPIKRFMAKVDIQNDCWLWVGSTTDRGYGQFRVNKKKMMRAHRWAYEYWIKPIPDGLTIDHLCRVRNCVNPDHLEAVTQRENTLRGNTITAVNKAKTHCLHGHSLNDALIGKNGRRSCRICSRDKIRRHRASIIR